MGLIYADVKLVNGSDVSKAKLHEIGEEEIRSFNVRPLVDTGALMLCINESIQEYLQLPIMGRRRHELANGDILSCDIVGPMIVYFENRMTCCDAVVLPGDTEPLLGVIPLEAMDVVVNIDKRILEVNPEHPEVAVAKCVSIRPAGFSNRRHWDRSHVNHNP